MFCCPAACLQVSLLHRREVMRKEHRVLLGLHELLTYGLKGVAAYAHHAEMLGKVDPELDNMFEEVSECCFAGWLAGWLADMLMTHVLAWSYVAVVK